LLSSRSPRGALFFKSSPELLSLALRQVSGFVLVIQGKKPYFFIRQETVVNDPESAAFSFSSPGILPSHLADPASAGDQISDFRVRGYVSLKFRETVIVEVVLPIPAESRSFNEFKES
jgi:hypothetical protein